MNVQIREFTAADYDAAMAIWRAAPGVVLRDADAREPLVRYLSRNPGLSFVAVDGDEVVGAVLCGTDGRRGYLQHLAVSRSHQRRAVGRRLADACIEALAHSGIDKCHLMILSGNTTAASFWKSIGWTLRDDVQLMSHIASSSQTG
ncbi:MAG TPA: GNAT family N-acetyltransferase [Gemmatimonadaceae bacterium]